MLKRRSPARGNELFFSASTIARTHPFSFDKSASTLFKIRRILRLFLFMWFVLWLVESAPKTQRPLLNNNKMNSRTSAHQNHYQEPSHRKDKTSILRKTQRNLHFNCDFSFYRFFFQSCYSLANTGHNSSNRMCFPGRTLEQLPSLSFLVFCQVSTAHVPSVSSVSLVTNDPPSVWSCP